MSQVSSDAIKSHIETLGSLLSEIRVRVENLLPSMNENNVLAIAGSNERARQYRINELYYYINNMAGDLPKMEQDLLEKCRSARTNNANARTNSSATPVRWTNMLGGTRRRQTHRRRQTRRHR